ncbi:MAG: hypothetical protein ACKVWV_07735 [Planctomycetota bacterium]
MTANAERTDRLLSVALRTAVIASIACIAVTAYWAWRWYAAGQSFQLDPSGAAADALGDEMDATLRGVVATLACGVLITFLALARNARRSATPPQAPWR